MRCRLPPRERGSVMMLYVLLITVMFALAALVIDIAALRVDARSTQQTADLGSIAGAAVLDPVFGGDAFKACEAAWAYVRNNAPGMPVTAPSPCATFSGPGPCDATTPPTEVTAAIGDYTVTIRTPVPDGAAEMEGRLDPDVDGGQCSRIAVVVERTRTFVLGPVLSARDGGVRRAAVARSFTGSNIGEGVPLVLLDPTGCKSLLATGQAKVIVSQGPDGRAGMIVVDSSATETQSQRQERNCSNAQDFAVDPVGDQNSKIEAVDGVDSQGNPLPAAITIFGLAGAGASHAYDPADVADLRLVPRPIPGPQVGRRSFDNRFNCTAAIECPKAGQIPAYIDDLRALVGPAGSGAPPGFVTYPGPCRTQPSDPPVVMAAGNWWVNCTRFDLNSPLTFPSGNVVFEGRVNVGSSTGLLSINATNLDDYWVYFRNGDFIKDSQSSLSLQRTMVYLHNGVISFGAGSGVLTWIAPIEGDFEDLALWSESPNQHDLGGQASLNIEGAFFTPNAWPFRFTGQGAQYQTKAQFVSFRLEVGGQGQLILSPDPDRMVPVILAGVQLIR